MKNTPCLSVIMPVFNEKDTILLITDKLLALDFVKELIIIEDGSTDGTKELIAGLNHPRIKVILHPANMGKGASIRDGFKLASGPVVAIQDADLEYEPGELRELMQPVLDGEADVVYGSRFSGKKHCNSYFLHRVGNKTLTLLTNILFLSRLTDMETCYKVFSRKVISGMEIKSRGFSVEPEITAKILKKKFKIIEIGISYKARTYAQGKKINWTHALSAALTLLRFRFTD